MFNELIQQWGGRDKLLGTLGHEPLHGRIPAEIAASMITWNGIAELLVQHRLAPPDVKVVHTGGKNINPKHYLDRESSPRRAGQPVVDIGRLRKILSAGATVVIESIDELLPQIGETAHELSGVVGEWVQTHLYATKGSTPAFAPHWDVVDVLIVQIEGEKHWDVYGPGVQHPIDADTDPDNTCPETLIWSGVLHPGDVLYLPRGWFHGVRGTGGTSIHLSYGFHRRTGLAYLGWLLGFAKHTAAFREDIPRAGGPEERERHGKVLTENLVQLVRDHPLDVYLAAHAARVVPPVNPGLEALSDHV